MVIIQNIHPLGIFIRWVSKKYGIPTDNYLELYVERQIKISNYPLFIKSAVHKTITTTDFINSGYLSIFYLTLYIERQIKN